MVLCVFKRARTGTFSDKLWSTPKIRKATTTFIKELHVNGPRDDIEETLAEIRQEFYKVPDCVGETFSMR